MLDLENAGGPSTKHLPLRRTLRYGIAFGAVVMVSLGGMVFLTGRGPTHWLLVPEGKASASVDVAVVLPSPSPSPLSSPSALERGGRSARWVPLSLTSCSPSTPRYFAPCLAARREGAILGEELIYPDFRLRAPIFAPSRATRDKEKWRGLVDGVAERASWCAGDDWVCYLGQHGQNIVLANATFRGTPPADGWSQFSCMGEGVTTLGIDVAPANETLATVEEYNAAYPIDTLVVATSPDSWSFQHFLDRITHTLMQADHITASRPGTPHLVSGRAPGKAVVDLYGMLGWPSTQRHHGGGRQQPAKALVFSCRTPLIHPYLSLRTLEALGLDPAGVPLAERKKIVYASRSHGHASNGGRKVVNEDALLDEIRTLLEERGEGEELVLFREDDYPSQDVLIEYFHRNVRALIGPHGGALFHHRWTGQDTLVLEMMPRTFTAVMFWEEASVLGQVYANMILPPVNGNDMRADIPAVLEILSAHLGKPDARGPAVQDSYHWNAPELQG